MLTLLDRRFNPPLISHFAIRLFNMPPATFSRSESDSSPSFWTYGTTTYMVSGVSITDFTVTLPRLEPSCFSSTIFGSLISASRYFGFSTAKRARRSCSCPRVIVSDSPISLLLVAAHHRRGFPLRLSFQRCARRDSNSCAATILAKIRRERVARAVIRAGAPAIGALALSLVLLGSNLQRIDTRSRRLYQPRHRIDRARAY